jgi:carbon monoxide dehydrogenase subunit G
VQRFDHSQDVGAPPAACWAVLTDADRLPEWFTIASSVDVSGPAGLGQELAVEGSHLGMTVTVPLTVDVWDEPAAYGWSADQPLPLTFRFTLTDTASGCRVHGTVDADVAGLPRVAVRVAIRSLRQQFARSLRELAALSEAEAGAAGD